MYRRCIAVEETRLSVKSVHERTIVNVNAGSYLNSLILLEKALKMRINKPLAISGQGLGIYGS